MNAEVVPADGVVFFDLVGALVAVGERGYEPMRAAPSLLSAGGRRGVLCNRPPGADAREVRWILEEAGIYELLEPGLIVVASQLPCPLPDRRAFAVAAAIAGAPVSECFFVSGDASLREAAESAGMQTVAPADPGLAPVLASDGAWPAPELAALTPVDEDTGPTFVLEGRIVTMGPAGEVIERGQLLVSRGRIVAVRPAGEQLPPPFASARRKATGGTIYPGLIDLHNHFVYNVLPLWEVPRLYQNRSQWPRNAGYPAGVTLPVRALAESPTTARALVRYVEAKALIGGTTTGQGIRTRVNGGPRLFRGAMRNVEETGDSALPEAGTLVPTLYVNEDRVRSFRSSLERRVAYFYHLAEGVDEAAHRTYADLADNDLIRPSLVGIHCLGLRPEDLETVARAGAKAIWSPFSNMLLYGRTVDLKALQDSGVAFAIGCDWSPTGSKNLLQELKVARWAVQAQASTLTDADLVRAVTAGAARVLGWHDSVGSIVPGGYADLLVLAGDAGDPYSRLIEATERDVSLVAVHGIPRYGDRDLMQALHSAPEHPLEDYTVDGAAKSFYLRTAGSDLNDLGFGPATDLLRAAMADLPGFREASQQERAQLTSMDLEPSFAVQLDNEWEPVPGDVGEPDLPAPALAADWSQLADRVELDAPEVGADDYWERIAAQGNIDDGLKDSLRRAYGG
jgi:5-methylthioadenosine/S-adenosylhomocysteine deaminase